MGADIESIGVIGQAREGGEPASIVGFNIGQKVRVSASHWLRPNEVGVVLDPGPLAEEVGKVSGHRILVEFPPRTGGGILGRYLVLEANQLVAPGRRSR